MVRQKVKGTGHKQPADAKTEPNFYAMPPLESAGSSTAPSHYFGGEGGYLPPQQQQQQQPQERQGSPVMAPTFSGRNMEQQQQRQGSPMMSTSPTYSSRNVEQEQQQQGSSLSATSPPAYGERNVVQTYSQQYSPRGPRYQQLPPVLDSPASPGLHGAAHLLQGIASGYGAANLRMPDSSSLGPAASDDDQQGAGSDSTSSQQHQGTPVSFLQPRLSSPPSSYKQQEYSSLEKH